LAFLVDIRPTDHLNNLNLKLHGATNCLQIWTTMGILSTRAIWWAIVWKNWQFSTLERKSGS